MGWKHPVAATDVGVLGVAGGDASSRDVAWQPPREPTGHESACLVILGSHRRKVVRGDNIVHGVQTKWPQEVGHLDCGDVAASTSRTPR